MISPKAIGACGRFSTPCQTDNHRLCKAVVAPNGKTQPSHSASTSLMSRDFKESKKTQCLEEHRAIVPLEQRVTLVEKDLVGHGWEIIRLIIWI